MPIMNQETELLSGPEIDELVATFMKLVNKVSEVANGGDLKKLWHEFVNEWRENQEKIQRIPFDVESEQEIIKKIKEMYAEKAKAFISMDGALRDKIVNDAANGLFDLMFANPTRVRSPHARPELELLMASIAPPKPGYMISAIESMINLLATNREQANDKRTVLRYSLKEDPIVNGLTRQVILMRQDSDAHPKNKVKWTESGTQDFLRYFLQLTTKRLPGHQKDEDQLYASVINYQIDTYKSTEQVKINNPSSGSTGRLMSAGVLSSQPAPPPTSKELHAELNNDINEIITVLATKNTISIGHISSVQENMQAKRYTEHDITQALIKAITSCIQSDPSQNPAILVKKTNEYFRLCGVRIDSAKLESAFAPSSSKADSPNEPPPPSSKPSPRN